MCSARVLNQVLLHQSIIGLESEASHGAAGRISRHRHRAAPAALQPRRR
ncbi:MAG: hypothetical protein ACLRWQ_01245 [Flavonifractor plautii]